MLVKKSLKVESEAGVENYMAIHLSVIIGPVIKLNIFRWIMFRLVAVVEIVSGIQAEVCVGDGNPWAVHCVFPRLL